MIPVFSCSAGIVSTRSVRINFFIGLTTGVTITFLLLGLSLVQKSSLRRNFFETYQQSEYNGLVHQANTHGRQNDRDVLADFDKRSQNEVDFKDEHVHHGNISTKYRFI